MTNTGIGEKYKMPKNSAMCLYYNENFIGTIYFRDEEEITVYEFHSGVNYIVRDGYMIYFTNWVGKENYL